MKKNAPTMTLDEQLHEMNEALLISSIRQHELTGQTENADRLTRDARDFAYAILRTSPVALLVLESDLRVLIANEAFYLKFQVSPEETEGRLVYELGNGQWNIPKLRELLQDILPNQSWFEHFEVTHEFQTIGLRTMLLNARRLNIQDVEPPELHGRIVLVIDDITERKRTEKTSAFLASIVETSDDAIITKGLDGVITSWNRGAERLFGYTIEEAIGQPITMLVPSDRLGEEPKIIERLKRGELVDHFETRRVRKDGSLLEISLTISPVKDADGRVIGASKIARDITERKQAEAALRESQEQLRRNAETFADLVEHAPFGIYTVDSEFRIALVSDGAQAAFRNVRPLIGRDFAEAMRILWPEPFASEVIDIFRRTLETGEPYVAPSLTEHRRDVEVVESYEWQTQRVMFPNGEYGVVCHFFDATRLRQAEQALRESEELRRYSQQAAGAGTWSWNQADNAVKWSPECYELFGIDPHTSLLYDSWRNVLHPDDRERADAAARQAMERGEDLNVEYRINHSQGGLRWLTSIGRMIDPQNRPGYMTGISLDITERKTAEEQLRQTKQQADEANRAKDMFLATLSHEIRTPLSAIVGWMQILQGGTKGGCTDEEIDEGIAVVERNARAMVQLMDDVLDVSRIVSGKVRLEVRPCELSAVICDGVDVVRSAAEAKDITLTAELDPAASPTSCDPDRMQQVVWNLVSNAVKFTPKGGAVHVTLSRHQSEHRIEVADSGQGMGPDLLPYVFDRFRQADSSTRRRFGGLGLGLSIVKHLVELHGGTVHAQSAGEGQGATFTVLLPIRAVRTDDNGDDAALESDFEQRTALPLTRLDALRVLVVDDDPDARRLLVRVLEQAGAVVTAAASAAEAVAALDQVNPEVLVSDIGMPDEDGFDLIRQVRASGHHAKDLPAVALTAFVRKQDRRDTLLAGFQMHVAKPVDPHDLTAAIATLAGRTG